MIRKTFATLVLDFYLGQRTEKNPEAKIRGQFDGVVKSSSNRHAIVVNGHVYSVFS